MGWNSLSHILYLLRYHCMQRLMCTVCWTPLSPSFILFLTIISPSPPIPFLSIYQQGTPTAHACPGRAAWPGCCPLQGEWLYSWAQLAFLVAAHFSLWVPVTPRVCLHPGVPSRLLLLGFLILSPKDSGGQKETLKAEISMGPGH